MIRNLLRTSGVYSSMRCMALVLVCSLPTLAQPRQEPIDTLIQSIWQARNEGRWQDVATARQQARDLLRQVPIDSPRFEGWVRQVQQAYQS